VRDGADADVGEVALRLEGLVEGDDLFCDFLGRAEGEWAGGRCEGLELGTSRGRPAALPADPVHHVEVRGDEGSLGLPARVCEERVRVDCDARLADLAGFRPGLPVEIDERLEAGCLAADDRERQRQAEAGRPHDGLGTAADRDPDGKSILGGSWPNDRVLERRAMLPCQVTRSSSRIASSSSSFSVNSSS
jgi:hypothetical protein